MQESATPGGPAAIVVTIGKRVFGLSPLDGGVLWEHNAGTEPRIEIVGDHVIVLGSRLRCLRCSDGSVMWEAVARLTTGTLLCTDDRILVGGLGEVACYDHAGTLLWHNQFKGKGLGQVALAVPGKSSQVDHTGG